MGKKSINIFVPNKENLKYRNDPAVKYEWFPIDRSKNPRKDAKELEKCIDIFLENKEKVAVEYMSIRDSGKLVGGGFVVYYRLRNSRNLT